MARTACTASPSSPRSCGPHKTLTLTLILTLTLTLTLSLTLSLTLTLTLTLAVAGVLADGTTLETDLLVG